MSYGKPRELPPVSAQHSQLPLCREVPIPYMNQLLWHQPREPIRGDDWNGDWDMNYIDQYHGMLSPILRSTGRVARRK